MAYNWKRLSQFWIQMLDLNDIVVFARVVEAGSFTAAARLLGMPKTTVSRRIAALEREVGVRLVQRTTRSLNMTDAGRLYYEQSSQALRTIEDANLRLAEVWHFGPLGAGLERRSLLAIFQFPFWHSGDRFDLSQRLVLMGSEGSGAIRGLYPFLWLLTAPRSVHHDRRSCRTCPIDLDLMSIA